MEKSSRNLSPPFCSDIADRFIGRRGLSGHFFNVFRTALCLKLFLGSFRSCRKIFGDCVDPLENQSFLLVTLEVLKLVSWLGGSYVITYGLVKLKKGWRSESKKDLFLANLSLTSGTLLILLFFKQFLMK